MLPLWEKILSPDVDEDFLCVVINPRHDDVLIIYHRITEEAALLLPTIFEENPLVAIKNIERISFDFIKSDGTLKMILAGDEFHIRSFIELLNELEQEGRIFFGSNSSHSSILTHVIETEERIYTGLLDVSDGGYIKASQVLKDKMLIDKKEI